MDQWDAIDILEGYVHEPGFDEQWRAFVRSCSQLVPNLPTEAQRWVAAADEFEQGRLTADELAAVRVQAWQFRDSRRTTALSSELATLDVAMFRLWPEHDPHHWDESASYFLDNCDAAGVTESQRWPLLLSQFPVLLAESRSGGTP